VMRIETQVLKNKIFQNSRTKNIFNPKFYLNRP